MKKVFAMPLVVLSILAGMLHGYHQHQTERAKIKPSLPVNPPPKKTKPPIPVKPPVPRPPIPKPPVNPTEIFSLKKVHQLFNCAGASFEAMDYHQTSLTLKKSMRLLAQKSQTVSGKLVFSKKKYTELYLMMNRLLKRSVVYQSLIQNIPYRKLDTLKNLCLVEFPQGARVVGLNYHSTTNQITFETMAILSAVGLPESIKKGEPAFLPVGEVKTARKLSYDQYKTVVEKWVAQKTSVLAPENFMQYYRYIYFCVKNRVFGPVSSLLTRVLRGKNGILLIEAFANHPTYDIYMLKYFWLYSEELAKSIQLTAVQPTPVKVLPQTSPNPPPVQPSTPSLPPERRTEEQPVVSLSSNLKNLMEQGRKKFQEGMTYYRQIYLHKEAKSRERYIREAIKRFRKAYDFYERVAKKQPNLAGLEKTMYRLSTLIYDCQNMMHF